MDIYSLARSDLTATQKMWSRVSLVNPNRRYPRERTSAGLILCREGDTGPEVLLIQQKCTYAFAELVLSNFKTMREALSLLCNTTLAEKYLLYSFNFDQIWRRLWSKRLNSKVFDDTRRKFFNKWMYDLGSDLKKTIDLLIEADMNIKCPWGFPKGKPNKGESTLSCAMRELKEETGLSREHYDVVPNFVYSFKFSHWAGVYGMTYYLGLTRKSGRLSQRRRSKEISFMRWTPLAELNNYTALPGHCFLEIQKMITATLSATAV